MDEISEIINDKNSNPNPETETLLWVDDVVLISNNIEQMQEMLHLTNEIAKRYRIEFGKDKSKLIKINSNIPTNLRLGDMDIEEVEKYKYLGEIINTKANMKDHIETLESKVEGTYQTILYIAKNENFKDIKMATIWRLIETCIIPIITYGAETRLPTKKEEEKIQSILNNILKRALKIPQSTPNDALITELGIMDINSITTIRQLNNYIRITKMDNNSITKNVLLNSNRWMKQIRKLKEDYQIKNIEQIHNQKIIERYIKNNVHTKLKNDIQTRNEHKTKMSWYLKEKKEWHPGTRAKYLEELTRKQCTTIFEARTRMTKVKGNYKNINEPGPCRACKKEQETQEHILEECESLVNNEEEKIKKTEIFSEDINSLVRTAKRIEERLKQLNLCNNDRNEPTGV